MRKTKISCTNCKRETYYLTYNLIDGLVLECAHCSFMRRIIDVEFSYSKHDKGSHKHRYIRIHECDTCNEDYPEDRVEENSRGNLVCKDCMSK